jgi:Flp pilus assembly protein protease CpaA
MLLADAVLLATVLLAAVTDSLERKIHNTLTFPMMLGGILFHVSSQPLGGWWQGLAGLFAVGLPFFGLYALSPALMGSGDVKLLMAVGALGGVRVALIAGVGSLVVAGPLALLLLIVSGRLGAIARVFSRSASPSTSPLKAPFGIAIALASIGAVAARDLH